MARPPNPMKQRSTARRASVKPAAKTAGKPATQRSTARPAPSKPPRSTARAAKARVPQRPLPRRPPRERLLVDERRARLLALALELFGERSYDDISVDEIARAAGISKGLLYHYFPTKRDFYVAAIGVAAGQLIELTTESARDVPPDERVQRGLTTYLEFVERHAGAYTTLMRGGIGADPEVAALLEHTRATFVSRIASQVPSDLLGALPALALRGWVGLVEAVALDWITSRPVPRDAVVQLCATLLFQTLAAASSTLTRPGV